MDPVMIEIEMLKKQLNQIEIELCSAFLNLKQDAEKISELYETVQKMNDEMRRKNGSNRYSKGILLDEEGGF